MPKKDPCEKFEEEMAAAEIELKETSSLKKTAVMVAGLLESAIECIVSKEKKEVKGK